MIYKKLTKVQYEALKPYERNLRNAASKSFVHMTGDDFEKVAKIYAEVFGTPLTKSQMGCNTCRLNALRKLGELYVAYERHEEPKTPKKAGRPRKLEIGDGVQE
jgi:hypothetical protein